MIRIVFLNNYKKKNLQYITIIFVRTKRTITLDSTNERHLYDIRNIFIIIIDKIFIVRFESYVF